MAGRLHEQDVHLGVLRPVPLHPVLHPAVEHDAQGLVQDPGHALVAQRAAQRAFHGLVQDGDQRVDADHQVRAVLDGQVGVGRLLDATVHVVPALDADGPVQAGQGRGGLDGLGDRHAAPALLPEGHGLSAVEVHGHDEERAAQPREGVGKAAPAEELGQELAHARVVEEAGGQQLEERQGQVGEAPPPAGQEGRTKRCSRSAHPRRPLAPPRTCRAATPRSAPTCRAATPA